MNTQDFAFWLQGYVEICGARPDDTQWLVIKDHLKEVFDKRTPERVSYYNGTGLTFRIATDGTGSPLTVQTEFISC